MCTTCGNPCCTTGCPQCYPSVPNQWNTCPTVTTPCPPVPCPTPVPLAPPFPFNGIYTEFVRVLSDQTALFGTPATKITLVPAPGAGKMIVPLNIFNIIVVQNPAVAYEDLATNTPTAIIELGGLSLISDGAILGSLVDTTNFYTLPTVSFAGLLDNQPLTLTTNNQPVVGNSNLYTYITYTTISV